MPSIQQIFQILSADLAAKQPDAGGAILCPLCMRPFAFEAIAEKRLSVEHIIPSALGGTLEAITCTECNNSHGAAWESHLVKAMQTFDSLDGKGIIPAVLHNDSGHVAANIAWRIDAPTEIKIVGKASNPAGISAVRGSIKPDATLNLTMKFGFMGEPYYRALLRVAYLAAFAYFGYGFILREGASQIRQVLNGDGVPTAIFLEAHPEAELPFTAFVHRVPAEGIGAFSLALFQLRTTTTSRWFAALLPGDDGCTWDRLGELAAKFTNAVLQVNPVGTAPAVAVRFSPEPMKKRLAFGIPPAPTTPQRRSEPHHDQRP